MIEAERNIRGQHERRSFSETVWNHIPKDRNNGDLTGTRGGGWSEVSAETPQRATVTTESRPFIPEAVKHLHEQSASNPTAIDPSGANEVATEAPAPAPPEEPAPVKETAKRGPYKKKGK